MILSALLVASLGRQLPPPQPKPLVGPRSLSLSPDGTRIAFSYLGDIWVAPSKGGRAVPVSSHVELDDNPVWSPDGNWIAFSTNRNGSVDIYAVPADGGQSKRITSFSNTEIPTDFTPDGKQILFRNLREKQYNGIYGVDLATGCMTEYFLDPSAVANARMSSDGKSIVYSRLGFPWVRPRYQGSAAAQLWKYDVATGNRSPIRNNGFQHLWPQVLPGGETLAVTVEEKTPSTANVSVTLPKNVDNVRRTPNVYKIDERGNARRVTEFVGQPVRFLTASRDGKTIAYENDGDVYVGSANGKAEKVNFTAVIDDKLAQQERVVLRDGAESSTWSADGSTIVVTVRGELWSVKTKKGKGPNADDATQLTTWAGTDNQPLFTPDGKAVFFVSDRDAGASRLFRLELETGKVTPVTTDQNDVESLKLTPDKKAVSFWKVGRNGGLYTVPVEGGVPTKWLDVSASDGRDYAFSPDMKWVAYEEPLLRSGYYYWENAQNIRVMDLATKTSHDVTQVSASHRSPAWSADGKYLYCLSNRDGEGIYAVPLKEEDLRANELDLKYEKPKTPVAVEIDFDGIEKRVRRLAGVQAAGILVDPDTGDLLFLSGGDVWSTSYAGENTKKLTNGGGFSSVDWSGDGKALVGVRNGVPAKFDLRAPGQPVTAVAFRADWDHDLLKERKAAFDQFWRAYNRGFYDPNFHGRDWAAIRPHYEKLLPSVGHRTEFSTILNEMVGELESSHSEVSGAPGPAVHQTAHLGVTYDYTYQGLGIKIASVPPRTPGSYAKSRLLAGDVIEQVNGKTAILTDEFLNAALSDQVGRDVNLKVRGKDGNLRDVKLRALSNSDFYGLMAENRFEERRKAVEKMSGGTVAYVHIAGMDEGELRRFNLEVWQQAQGKKGLIIDVRENGGGNTSDRIIDVLERLPNAFYAPRDEPAFLGPGQALGIPFVVMCDESSFSNAEMFPAAMKSRKLATLVGRPTPGYVIYTYGLRLVDGTNARMPQTGAWRLDGTPLENNGVVPDYVVDWDVAERLAGKDVQLAKAVEVLKK